MTDKQIIIDGVDVSGCCHQGKNETCTCPHYKNECIRNPNCHYKIMQRQTKKLDKFHKRNLELEQQLKRKEQECEELKAELELFKTSNQTTIDQLKAENETLFKAIEEVNKINKRLETENERLEAHSATLDAVIETGRVQNKALKQTLAEIKEIVENHNTNAYCNSKVDMRKILQKINEVEKG